MIVHPSTGRVEKSGDVFSTSTGTIISGVAA